MIKKIKNKLLIIIFAVIIIMAGIIRFYDLANYPVGFHIDEAVLGYNGYSFLKTGTDESGKRFPLYIDTFGDQNPIGYHLLTILPVSIFGLTEFATRFPAALFGILSVIGIYFLAQIVFRDKRISILAALFIAISPWSINLSRGSSEAYTSLFFVISGFACLLFSLRLRRYPYLIPSAILFICSYLLYPASRVFVPFFAVCIFFYFFFDVFIKRTPYRVYYAVFLGVIIFVSAALVFIAPGGTNRFQQTSVFSYPEVRLVLEEQYREDGTFGVGSLAARFFHNKLFNFSLAFLNNYFAYFSGQFLFISGGLPLLTVIPNTGLVYIVELPFILYGIYRIFSKKDKYGGVIVLWLFLAPVTAALTVDDSPNVRRAALMVPAIEILAAYGVVSAFNVRKSVFKKTLLFTFAVLLSLSILYFLHQYFIHAHAHRPWARNNGFKEMMQLVNSYYDKADKVILTKTGGGYPLVLFFSQYNPETYIQEGSPKDPDYKGFGKYIFVPQECPSLQGAVDTKLTENIVYVDRGNCEISAGLLNRTDIPREDGSTGFRVYYREGISEDSEDSVSQNVR